MKQLFLSFVAVGLLATASWAGSEVETPMPITPEHEVACTAQATITHNNGAIEHISVTAATCEEASAMLLDRLRCTQSTED